jgi:hypothetical protein
MLLEPEVLNVRLPVFGSFKPILAIREVMEGLLQLVLSVKNKGTSPCDGLCYRLASEEDEACVVFGSLYSDYLLFLFVRRKYCTVSFLQNSLPCLKSSSMDNDH